MMAIIIAIISGISMALQGVFNTRLEEKIGTWETNIFVQGTALIITLGIFFFFGNGDFKAIKDTNKLYLLGGILSVIIIFTVMKSIGALGPTFATGTILIAQITTAGIIDALGLFNTEKVPFSLNEYIGVGIMVLGIIIFKFF